LGGTCLAIATAFGLATVFANSVWLVVLLRYVGSAYLVWLGLSMIRDARTDAQATVRIGRVAHKPLAP